MMDVAEFLSSLAPALTRRGRGPGLANDVTLARTIRAELAQASKVGALPESTKCSVRIRHHASLAVEIVEWHGAVFCDAYAAHLRNPSTSWEPGYRMGRRCADARYSLGINDALAMIEAIANRHNYDNSDVQTDHFDVGYYLTFGADSVADRATHNIRLEIDPAFAALVARASEAAGTLGPKVVRSVCGGDLATCGQWSLERLIKMAVKADGRALAYDKRRGWVPCSEGATS